MLRKLKFWIKQAFHFSDRESRGFLAIILLILLLIIALKVYKLYHRATYQPLDHSADIALLEKNLILLQENAARSSAININIATAAQLQEIVGMTPQLALRTIRYRDKLGGFVSSEQSNRLEARLRACTTISAQYKPKKISLNQASFQALVSHPYISVFTAKAIIGHRKKRGKFSTLRTLEKLPKYDPHWGRKIMPYLTL